MVDFRQQRKRVKLGNLEPFSCESKNEDATYTYKSSKVKGRPTTSVGR